MICTAQLDITLPTLRQGAPLEEQVQALYRYSRQLNERLRYILNNLDTDSFGEETALALQNAVKLTDTENENAQSMESLKQEFKRNATVIQQQIQSLTEQLQGTVKYTDGKWELVEQSSSDFTANAYGFALATDVVEYLNNVLGGEGEKHYPDMPLSAYTGLIEAGYNREEGAMCITVKGKGNGDREPMAALHTPDKVKFRKGDATLAYFGADDMYIKDVRSHTLRFRGEYNSRFFSFVAKDDPDDPNNGELLLQYGEYNAGDFESNLQG